MKITGNIWYFRIGRQSRKLSMPPRSAPEIRKARRVVPPAEHPKVAHCSASTRTANNVTTRHSKPKGYSITSPARTSMQDIELARISQWVWLA